MKETNMQRIKRIVAECDEAAEMVGILGGINAAAVLYCCEHCEEEIYDTAVGTKVTITGMKKYLESEA